MKRSMRFLNLLSATVLTVPILVSLGSPTRAEAATAFHNQAPTQTPAFCNSVDLTGTWVPNYVKNAEICDSSGYCHFNPKWADNIYQQDRVQISQSGCKLQVLDVKNNETWNIDMSTYYPLFTPNALIPRIEKKVMRLEKAGVGAFARYDLNILKSAKAETIPIVSSDRKHINGLSLNVYAEAPMTSHNPFAVDFKLKYVLNFQLDPSVYSSLSYQKTGQLPANLPVTSIELNSSTTAGDYFHSNLTILGVQSSLLPSSMAKAFAWGANWLIGALNDAQIPIDILPETLFSSGGGPGGNDGLTIIKVSNKLL